MNASRDSIFGDWGMRGKHEEGGEVRHRFRKIFPRITLYGLK